MEDRLSAIALYRCLVASRGVDRVEMELVNRGEAFFHVGAAGHEASAVLNRHLLPIDWLHLHYRDKALMLARGLEPEQFFHSVLCTAGSHSAGRQMSAHLSAPHLNLLSLVGPVGNNALQAVGVATELNARWSPGEDRPVVVCSMGDGTSQQGEVLEAIAEAVRSRLPVLFCVEDNGLGISTKTRGNTFYNHPTGDAAEFYGLPIHRVDGRDVIKCDEVFGGIVKSIRASSHPAIVVLQVARLTHHTNADDERVYRTEQELTVARDGADPLQNLRRYLVEMGVSASRLDELGRVVEQQVRAAAETALASPNPISNLDARAPLAVSGGTGRVSTMGNESNDGPAGAPVSMLEALRTVLRRQLAGDARVSLFGQDIEDPKGDVFGLTRGLSTSFPGRVKNSPLTESTIVGVSLGRALAGGRPVACIQFADFIPLAFNQIATELGSMFWRTDGGWRCPVIVLAPCGGYRPGLGPFHAQTFESLLAHVPGIDVMMPSTAEDAASMLNAAFENQAAGRPTVFLYPKVCLNDPVLATQMGRLNDVIQPGRARLATVGGDLTLVSWGATIPLCLTAAARLEEVGVGCEVVDLRSIAPWDADAVCSSVRKTGRLIVVHEDNLTCGFASEVLATVAERTERPVKCRRVTRPDTYVPCNYVNQLEVLPSLKRILSAASELCDLEFEWVEPKAPAGGEFLLEAVGSSPADQNVTVLEWKCQAGDVVVAGQMLAECEADKATFELRSPVSGRIQHLHPVDDKVPVGHVLARIETGARTVTQHRRVPAEGKAVMSRKSALRTATNAIGFGSAGFPNVVSPVRSRVLAISSVAGVPAGRVLTNDELVRRFPGRTSHDIVQRTGIESRPVLAEGETVLTLATKAARSALRESGLNLSDLDAIFVSTSSPLSLSPSMACLLHHELSRLGPTKDLPASDILAACTGYLFALQSAFDFCQSQPDANILVVTAEAMTQYTDPNDFDTAIVFADAATATVVHGGQSVYAKKAKAFVHRPVLSARGEDGTILHHGRRGNPNVNMDGLKVFPLAVRQMMSLLEKACAESRISVGDLDVIVPHQANGRILEAVASRLAIAPGRLINRVRHSGNTSSSTIPMVLADLLSGGAPRKGRAGLCAFGGGFTFGAAVLELGDVARID